MTDRELMQMALDALDYVGYVYTTEEENQEVEQAIEALRTALAQPEKTDMQIGITYEEANPPKPYCKRCGKKLGTEAYDVHTCTPKFDGCDCDSPAWCNQYKKCHRTMFGFEPYVAPFKKEWVGLTDEEIREGNKDSWVTRQAWESAAWWAEAKLKEKNT